jgi:hypothetical protein
MTIPELEAFIANNLTVELERETGCYGSADSLVVRLRIRGMAISESRLYEKEKE